MTHIQRFILCLLLLAATCGLRAPFLQRAIWNVDEGATVTAAEQILSGGVLYRDAADHRSPLVPYLKAGILMVCGDWNATAVHAVLAVLLGLGAIALWQIARRLGHDRAGLAAAAVFTVLSFMLPGAEDALAAHTEWFVLIFSVAGFLAFAAACERPGFRRGLGVGALFGLAILCKQPGLFDWAVSLVLIGLLLFARPAVPRGALLRLAAGSLAGLALLAGLTFGYFALHGAVPDLVYYAWTYNNQVYVPAVPLASRLLTMREPFLLAAQHAPAVLILGLCGALVLPVLAIRGLFRRPAEVALLPWLALGWTAAGILACSLSGRGFSHYSIQVIPGLSLVCGWVLVAGWDWCAGRKRAWRLTAMALLALAVADTGGRIARRMATTPKEDRSWIDGLALVRELTTSEQRIFVWGFAPDAYVYARRLPATRFIYTSFLTGMIPWENLDPLIDTTPTITPASGEKLREDFAHHPPAMIVDTGAARHQGKYPLEEQAWLWSLITQQFVEVWAPVGTPGGLRYFKRLDPVAGSAQPDGAEVAGAVDLRFVYDTRVVAVPRCEVRVQDPATRIELYRDGRLTRAVDLAGAATAVAFFLFPDELSDTPVPYVAVMHSPSGRCSSAPLVLSRQDLTAAGDVPGPRLILDGARIAPVASEAYGGQPVRSADDPTNWRTHPNARIVYNRPAGLRAFTFRYSMAPDCYYDSAAHVASDGVDFVVEFGGRDARWRRFFEHRMHPKTRPQDCGSQAAEIVLPDGEPGQIVIRVLPGPAGNYDFDWANVRDLEGRSYGPPLVGGAQRIPAERVSAHGEPVMTCDPEGKWTAHSPSSVSYELPVGARALVFDYGLEPASYDGSQSGRTDGIDIVVTGETAEGGTSTLYRRTINPAEVAGGRGRQTARIALADTGVRRVTIAVGPGPNDNFSFDWSYLADLRFEGSDETSP